MKIIVCLDDANGMMFNRRRQSRDRILLQDICNTVGNHPLWMDTYSEPLWMAHNIQKRVSDRFLDEAEREDYCFVENRHIGGYMSQVEELTVYRWNRRYPSDFSLDIDPHACGLSLISTCEFPGSSHEKITKEIYRK